MWGGAACLVRDVDVSWLRRFEAFLAKTSRSANGRAISLRNIRAVFNFAIDEERTTLYPYIDFEDTKIDEANRKVLDYVFGDIKKWWHLLFKKKALHLQI